MNAERQEERDSTPTVSRRYNFIPIASLSLYFTAILSPTEFSPSIQMLNIPWCVCVGGDPVVGQSV